MKLASWCLILVLAIAGFSYADIIHVPGDQPTIQAGIDAAQHGDTVLVADGTWTGEGNKNLDFKGKDIIVQSENGPESTIIDCENSGRGFCFHSSEKVSSKVDGFTIKNGNSDRGGGIYCSGGSSPQITNNIITKNSASSSGGGIDCGSSTSPQITNNIITENSATHGGGIYCDSSPVITNNIISGNYSAAHGSGIHCNSGSPIITNNIITTNLGIGIIFNGHSSSPIISNSIIAKNSGGGILTGYYTFLTIINCTISDNSGYGIWMRGDPSRSKVLNTIIWDKNLAHYWKLNITYSDILGGYPGQGNIDADPMFVDPDGDYHLQAGSPCIDAGDPSSPKDPDGTRADIGTFYYDQSPVPTMLEKVSGDNQSGIIGTKLPEPLVVLVKDQYDEPMPDVQVDFAVTQGDGSVNPSSILTDADGKASTELTLGQTAGLNQMTATVDVLSVTFDATGTELPVATTLEKISGDNQSGTTGAKLPEPLVVLLKDQYDEPMPDVQVNFAVTQGDGSVNPASPLTDVDGKASTELTLGQTAGLNQVTATVDGLSVIFNATGQTQHGTEVSGIIDTNTTWTLANSPYIVVGNILVNEGVTLIIEPGVAVKFNRDLYMYVDGTLIARGTESNMITFTSNQASPAKGDWQHLKFRDSAVDATFDEDGNYVSGCILEYCKVEYGTKAVWGDYAAPFINHSIVTQNSSDAIIIDYSPCRVSNCTVNDNGGKGIYLTGPNNSIDNCTAIGNYGHGISFYNSNNSRVNNCTVSDNGTSGISFADSDNSRVSNCTVSHNNGYGIYFHDLDNSEISDCTIIDNSGDGVYLTTASNNNSISNCTISGNGGDGIYLYYSNSSIFGSVITGNHDVGIYYYGNWPNKTIQYCDLYDNTNYEIKLEDNPNDVTATNNWWGTTDTDVINAHIWDFNDDFELGKVIYEPYLDASIGDPEYLIKVSGDNQNGIIGTKLPEPLVVLVKDQYDEPMLDVQVDFAVTSFDGSVNPTQAITDSDGKASTELTLGQTAGLNQVTATVNELSVIFNATGIELPVATTVEKVSGDNQSGNVGSTLPNPLVVHVLDQNSNPMAGVTVTFEPSEGASVNPTQATTDENGQAETILTLGSNPGEYNVTASVDGLDPVVFTATAIATLVVDAGEDKNICHPNNGGETQIGGDPTASGGTTPYTYSWTPTTGLDNPNIANPTANPTVTTTYTVTVTDSSEPQQEASDSVTITVNPELIADAGEDKEIAQGDSIQIGGNPTASGGTTPYTYSWTPTESLDDASIANPTASPSETTTYTVTVTDDNGCQDTDEIKVTVNKEPGIASVTEDTNGATKTVDDVITVTVTQADDLLTAVEGKFSIGDTIVEKQLTETSARVWTGTYTVVEGDMVDEQPVIATLKSDKGVWTEPPVASETKVTIDTIAEIDEIVLAPTTPVGIGAVITVTATGEANAQVTFSIGGVSAATSVPMTESTTNNYTGTYTVQAGDNAQNATITVTMTDFLGNVDSKESADKVTLDGIAPSKTTGLDAVAGDSQVSLSWNANISSDLSHYNVYRSLTQGFEPTGDDFVGKVDKPDTTFTDSGLENGTTYYYHISAVDSVLNESEFSDEVNAKPMADAPTISSVEPKDGSTLGGTEIMISGSHFQAGAKVKIGENDATVVSVVDDIINAITPAGEAGPADVVVENPDGQSDTLEDGFTYHEPPTIFSITPTVGKVDGGTNVEITGNNFIIGATSITFDEEKATNVNVDSTSHLTAVTPAHAIGVVDVVMTTEWGSDTLENGFEYKELPIIDSISPNSGTIAGGTWVTITGEGFEQGATVKIGENYADVETISLTEITAKTPAGNAGKADVVVTNPDGKFDTLKDGFTYLEELYAKITYPVEGDYIRGEIVITGTVLGGANGLKSWILKRATIGGQYKTISYGDTEVDNGELGSWDTTAGDEGQHMLRLTAVDNADNERVHEITVNVDNTDPAPVIQLQSDGASGDWTKDYTELYVSGEVEAGAQLIEAYLIFEGGLPFTDDVKEHIGIDGTGRIAGTIPDGYDLSGSDITTVTLHLRCKDRAGNEGEGTSNTLHVDNDKPTVTIQNPGSDANFNLFNKDILIAGIADDAFGISRVEINLYDGSGWILVDGTTNWQHDYFQNNEVAVVTVHARSIDNAGNASEIVEIKFHCIWDFPSVNISFPVDDSVITDVVDIIGLVYDSDVDDSDLHWSVDYGIGEHKINNIASGYGNKNGVLCNWDTRTLDTGQFYTLFLTVTSPSTMASIHRFDDYYVSSAGELVVKRYNISITEPPIIYGDVNLDGKVTPTDASLVMRHVVGELTLDGDQQLRADVTNDGTLSSMDAVLILQRITGLIPKFPVEMPLSY